MTSKLITTSIVSSRATEKHFMSYSVLFKYSLIYAGYMLLKGYIVYIDLLKSINYKFLNELKNPLM